MHLTFNGKPKEGKILLRNTKKIRELLKLNKEKFSGFIVHSHEKRSSISEYLSINYIVNESTNDSYNAQQVCWSGGRNH